MELAIQLLVTKVIKIALILAIIINKEVAQTETSFFA